MKTVCSAVVRLNEALDSAMSGAEATEHEVQQPRELDEHCGSGVHPAACSRDDGAMQRKPRDGGAVVLASTAAGAQHKRPLRSNGRLVRQKLFAALTAFEDFEVAICDAKAALEA